MQKLFILGVTPFVLLTACAEPSRTGAESEVAMAAPIIEMGAYSRAEMARVNDARFTLIAPTPQAALAPVPAPVVQPPTPAAQAADVAPVASVRYNAALVRIQVLLDRAHFSPGVIDGFDGENVAKAVSAYQTTHDLDITGRADDALLQTLAGNDAAGALRAYVITAADVRGPFVDVPEGLEEMSRLERVGFESAAEGLAEKFHMDPDLLHTLNPGADFTRAGTEIVVANAGADLEAEVATIEVDKLGRSVRAYDAGGQLLAFYPATIGSGGAPAPTGDHAVRAVAFEPTYHYDPARLPTFGEREHGALTIPAGPNNPVGAVWIALSADTYGIHGAPEPSQVSKSQSHGCVRLTNWDAIELARAVRAGVPVSFLENSADARSERAG